MSTSISRATLPQNFLDGVSALMRLPTPEPQYWFARAALGAQIALASLNAGAPTVQQFVSMLGGGAQLPPELDELARAADAFPGTVQYVDGYGLGLGDTVKFTRDVYSTGGLTKEARKLDPNKPISTTGQAVKQEEVPVVLEQFHGPYASGGSQPQPYAIPEFDAKYRKNKEALTSVTSRFLKRDYIAWMEYTVRDLFRVSQYTTLPDGLSTAASFVSGGTAVASLEQILRARKAITDRNRAKFANGRYIALVPTKFNTDMIGDVDYRELSKVHRDRNQLFGYIGSVQDVDFFEVSTLKQYVAGDVLTGEAAGTVASGVTLQEALIIGPGAVGFGSALGPECRWADDTNYGTLAKVIWLAYHAFQTLDEGAVQRVVFQ